MTGRDCKAKAIVIVPYCLLGLFAFATSSYALAEDATQSSPPPTFEQHIRPILKAYCFDCHAAEAERKGGLDLRLRRLMVVGGDSGPTIKPGDAENSYLYQRIRDGEMPPRDKKLPEKDLHTIQNWIAAGAPTLRDEPDEIGNGIGITPEDRAFWAFQPIRRPDVPQIQLGETVRTPIDGFLMDAMREKGLAFSPDADKWILLRRVTLDLTGLPPTPEESAQFLADDTDSAYENLIDRLLSSSHYG